MRGALSEGNDMAKEKVKVTEILEQPGGFKFALLILLFDGIGMVFDGYDFMIVSFCMPQIMAEMDLGYIATGALSSWSLLGMLIGGFFAGILADKFGRRHVLNISIMMYSLLTIPIYFIHSYDLFALCRIFSGMFIGSVIPMSVTLASEYAPTKHRGKWVTISKMCMMFGWVVAGLVAMFVVPRFGWRVCFLIGGFPFIYGILMYFLVPESVHWLFRAGKTDRAMKIINDINSKLDNPRPEPYTLDEIEFEEKEPKSKLAEVVSPKYRRVTIGIWLVAFLTCALSYGLTNWMPTILSQGGYTLGSSYALTTLMNAMGCIGTVFAGIMADSFGRIKSTYIACTLAIVACLFMAFFGFQYGLMIPACILMGFSINYAYMTPQPITIEAYPTEIRATGQACVTTVARIGGLIVPVLIGAVLESGQTFAITIAFFIIPLVLAMVFTKFLIRNETKGIIVEDLDK